MNGDSSDSYTRAKFIADVQGAAACPEFSGSGQTSAKRELSTACIVQD